METKRNIEMALYNPTPALNHTTLPNHHLATPILHSQVSNSSNLLFHNHQIPQSAIANAHVIPNLDYQLRNWMTECNSTTLQTYSVTTRAFTRQPNVSDSVLYYSVFLFLGGSVVTFTLDNRNKYELP